MRLTLPARLDDSGVAEFLVRLQGTADTREKLQLDFGTIEFAHPFGTLIAAEAIRRVVAFRRREGLETGCLAIGVTAPPYARACSYLGHVGFFKHMGWEAGNAPGEAPGSSTYLPITVVKSIDFGVAVPTKDLAGAVRQKSLGLAALVSAEEDTRDLLAYCFTEVIRNVFEHAGVSRCTVMAQKYAGRFVEIAIIDTGIGIASSLREAFPGVSPESALELAVKPGISRTISLGPQGNGVNAGFGLYVLSELGRQHGEFAIWSGGQFLTISQSEMLISRPSVTGTSVKIKVDTKDAEFFSNWLYSIVQAGEKNLAPGALRQSGPSKRVDAWGAG
jgi:anti-sigma regulatory factor (Ser/Thr protein kinase)